MYKLTLFILTTIIMTGCTDLRSHLPQSVTESFAISYCRDLLEPYEEYSKLTIDSRAKVLAEEAEVLNTNATECQKLRLAVLLSHPSNSTSERAKGLELLSGLLKSEKKLPSEARQLAVLLKDQMELERYFLLRIQKLSTTSQEQSKELSDMQLQLQQLKNIEESINEKERAIITPATSNVPSEAIQDSTGR